MIQASSAPQSFEEEKKSMSIINQLFTYSSLILGISSKTGWRRQREDHQTRDLVSKTVAVYVHYKYCIFLSRPLQNNSVK